MRFKSRVGTLKGKLIELGKVAEIAKGIYSTGEIPGDYNGHYMPEQALVVRSGNGISVITGCVHPGIVRILGKVREAFGSGDIYLVWGARSICTLWYRVAPCSSNIVSRIHKPLSLSATKRSS